MPVHVSQRLLNQLSSTEMQQFNNILKRHASEGSIRSAYAKVAWLYNLWSRLTESRAARKVIEIAEIRDGERILEVAVGTGLVFDEIVRRNPNGLTNGVDISPGMLTRAERLMKNQPAQRYHLQIASAYKLPFESNTFDLLVNNFMLDLLPEADFPAILSEYDRVLKPDARIVLSTMTFGRVWYNMIWEWIAKHIPSLLTGCRPVSMRRFLAEAGFVGVETFYLSQNTFPSEVVRARNRATAANTA
jgi:ubiquinone/menaquinone biosynthesis C-methylase UbiE